MILRSYYTWVFIALSAVAVISLIVDYYTGPSLIGNLFLKPHKVARSMGIEAVVDIGVGILALMLFAVSAMAYYRDRRTKFLVVSLAFLVYMIKGFLGVLDLLYPREFPILNTVADMLDFLILLFMFVAIVKD